jgi:hypothetical protein
MSEDLRILYPQHIAFLQNVIEVAHICGIESIIIGKDAIRGIDEDHSVCIIHATGEDIDLPFNRLAIIRAQSLKRKFDMAADMDDLMITVLVVDEEEQQQWVKKIVFSGYAQTGARIVVDHRCAHPKQVKAPGSVNDECTTAIQLPNGIYKFVVQAAKVLDTDEVRIRSGQDGVSLQLRAICGDVISHPLHDQPGPFCSYFRYSLKSVKTLLKASAEETTWLIGARGLVKTNLRGLDVYILAMA